MGEIGLNLDNSVLKEVNNNLEKEQKNFLETTFGKVINAAVDIGIKAALPDMIENQIIDVKNAILENGFEAGVKEIINKGIDTGKSVLGIATGNFDNISQIELAVKKGGILDNISDFLDYSINLANKNDIIDKTMASIIKKSKNTIISSISNKIEETLINQMKAVEKIEKSCENWKEAYGNKDLLEMEKSYKSIKKQMDEIVPLERIINTARTIENIQEMIKNSKGNIDLNEDLIKLAEKL